MRNMSRSLGLAMLLVFVTLLSGCNNNFNSAEDSMMKEDVINMPKEIRYITDTKLIDNELFVIGAFNNKDDLGIWEININDPSDYTLIDSVADKIPPYEEKYELAEFYGYFIKEDVIGCAVYYYTDLDNYKSDDFFYIINEDGTNQKLDIDFSKTSDLEHNSVSELYYTKSGETIVADMAAQWYKYDANTKLLSLCTDDINHVYINALFEDTIYGINEKDGVIINESDKDSIDRFKILSDGFITNDDISINSKIGVFEKEKRREYYLVDKSGLWHAADEGIECLVDGKRSMLGSTGTECDLTDIIVENMGSIFVVANTENGPILLHYTEDESNTTEERYISVYALMPNENNTIIDSMIKKYLRNHNDINIVMEIGIKDENDQLSDIVKKLNTKMLSGDGPDIIFFDGLNAKKYAEEGMLIDLSDIVETDGESFTIDLSADYSLNNNAFVIPAAFSYMSFSSIEKEKQPKSIKEFSDGLEKDALPEYSMPYVSGILYREYFEGSNVDGKIHEEDLRSFYEGLNGLKDSYSDYDNFSFDANDICPRSMDLYTTIGSGINIISLDYVRSLKTLQKMFIDRESNQSDFSIFTRDGEGIYIPELVVGISKSSQNIDVAKDFVKYILSIDGQKEIAKLGLLPINKEAFEYAMDETGESIEMVAGKTYELRPFNEEEKREILGQVSNMKKAVGNDSEIMNIVMKGAEPYLNGEIDIDNAVLTTMEKIEIYLAE